MTVDLTGSTWNAKTTLGRTTRCQVSVHAERMLTLAPASSRGSIATPLLSAHVAGLILTSTAAGTGAAIAIAAVASRLLTELDHVARRSTAPFRFTRRG